MLKVVLCVLALVAVSSAVPRWPNQLTTKYIANHPYANVSMPTSIYYDATNNQFKISYYDDLDYYIWRDNKSYYIYVAMDHQKCEVTTWDGEVPSEIMETLVPFKYLTYLGTAYVNGLDCDHYQLKRGDTTLDLYIKTNGESFYPVKSVAAGSAAWSNVFKSFNPSVDAHHFTLPSICYNNNIAEKADKSPEAHSQLSVHPDFEKLIKEHPADSSYTVGENHLTHMSFEEFRAKRLMRKGLISSADLSDALLVSEAEYVDELPEEMDWRQKGVVSKVQDQAECGSCYSFSSTASVETAFALKHGHLIKGSEQYIMDCAWNYDAAGCGGGLAPRVFAFLRDNGGPVPLDQYPYKMEDDYCKADKNSTAYAQVTSYKVCPQGDENCIKQLLQNGLVSVAIAVDPTFQAYRSGIYDGPCSSDPYDLDHEVNIVGYTKVNGEDVWILRNSWAPVWGDNGYAYMKMGKNLCGLAVQATQPYVA
eukprot:GCRY01000306.1.p1 GENE.GCRY01000306.1~~GCRY01000306.1.p1  ORF type:complete len:478 (-),score=109.49 GCRY01000306.1:138-1571(-)